MVQAIYTNEEWYYEMFPSTVFCSVSTVHSSTQDDVPKDSLKYFYGPDQDSDDKGGFATLSVTEDTITTTFFNYKGQYNDLSVT